MATLSTADLSKQLYWRYATKQFEPTKTIPDDVWDTLEEALILSPSSYGLQPWLFVVIKSADLKEQLKPLSWNQNQITDCSHLVVFAIKKNLTTADVDRFIESTATTRNAPLDSLAGYRNMIVSDVVHGPRSFTVNEWAARQAYIALGNFMTSAAVIGIDTCPLEGIDPAGYDKVLSLQQDGYATVVACAAGYRSADDKYAELAKVRYPKSEMIRVL
ncbi:MAG: NAD(P)H-dependent oxidoreductase [Cyanobacteria bacterium J06614_10]